MAQRQAWLMLCDTCCDNAGVFKELIKTGGCTCEVCGWSCQCSGDDCRQFVNKTPVHLIPDDGWGCLQIRNEASLTPLDFEALLRDL